jgi:hypothetical protein
MLGKLQQAVAPGDALSFNEIGLRLVASAVLGTVVACIYHFTRAKHEDGSKGFITTIVLLSILLSIVVMTVGGNLARAFSLAGVLAIVRFRTVVEDTRDSAFVICSVVMGMAAGAGTDYLLVAVMGLPFIAVAAFLTRNGVPGKSAQQTTLKVRLGLASGQQAAIENIVKKYADSLTLIGSATARQGAAFDLSYQLRLKPNQQTAEMVRELNKVDGVQEVEWKA